MADIFVIGFASYFVQGISNKIFCAQAFNNACHIYITLFPNVSGFAAGFFDFANDIFGGRQSGLLGKFFYGIYFLVVDARCGVIEFFHTILTISWERAVFCLSIVIPVKTGIQNGW